MLTSIFESCKHVVKGLFVLARQERITVMLEQEIKDRVHFYAAAMGLTDSALGAYIFGSWVMQQDRANGPLLDEMKKLMVSAVQQQMEGMVDLVANGTLPEEIESLAKGEGVPVPAERIGSAVPG